MMGAILFPCFLSVSSSVEAKPKLPCMNSSLFCGRFTPARLNTKVAVGAVGVQLLRRAVDVVAVDVVDVDIRARAVFAVADVFQIVDEGCAHHALRAGDEDVHFFPASQFASASLT